MPTEEEQDLPIVSRSHGLYVRQVYEETRSIRVIASTDSIDSYDEIVEQSWDLKRYKKNPVVLYGHMSRELPIGTATDIGLVNGQLEATLHIVSEKANPKAEQVWQLLKEGALRAVSVGFNPRDIRRELRNDVEVYVLSDNELFEISIVPIPANPDAMMKMRAKAAGRIEPGTKSALAFPGTEATATPTPATIAEQPKETTMTTDEQKALEAKNAEVSAKLELAVAGATTLTNENKALTVRVSDVEKLLEVEKAKTVTLSERCTTLETERAAQQKRADDLVAKSVERDLNDLIGVKISPAEKPGLIKLAALDETLYAEQLAAIKSRPDMKMLGTVVGTDPTTPPSTVTGDADDGGDDLLAAVNKRVASMPSQN